MNRKPAKQLGVDHRKQAPKRSTTINGTTDNFAPRPRGGTVTVLLRVEQVALMLSVSKRTVWRLVSGGQLPQPVSIGRCKRWKQTDVEQFVEGLS